MHADEPERAVIASGLALGFRRWISLSWSDSLNGCQPRGSWLALTHPLPMSPMNLRRRA